MSKIEWTEKTWNPITGCTKVSAGCKNCYAEVIAQRFWKDRKFIDVQFHEDRLSEPLHRKKPTMYFVNSMSDLFHEDIHGQNIINILEIMKEAKQHIFQVLTKRPERMKAILDFYDEVLPNVWYGISIENQAMARERLTAFRETKAHIKFVSYEPALMEVSWDDYEFINWIIAGGESGQKKRINNIEWFRLTRDWAQRNKIAFFMKQIDKVQEIPEDLMIREYPLQPLEPLVGNPNEWTLKSSLEEEK